MVTITGQETLKAGDIGNFLTGFEVLNPDGSLYVNRTVLTTSNGIATITFGPTSLLDEAVGVYNVTIRAERGPSDTDPKVWYGRTTTKMYIQVGYGIYIAYIESITSDVAQGDLFQCNLTLKNDRKNAAYINITANGDIFIENSSLINFLVEVGYTEVIVHVKVDERTIPNQYYSLLVNLLFQEKYISNESISILVKNSITATELGIPTQIAEGDLRYAIFHIKNEKILVDANFSLEVICPTALNYIRLNETLVQNSEDYFYIPLTLKDLVSYNSFSGTIRASWVNYSIDFDFTIQVRPDLSIGTILMPISIYQNQNSLLTVQVDNYKSTPIQVLAVVTGTGGFEPSFMITNIDSFSSGVVLIPCLFKPLPWETGLNYLQLSIFLVTDSGLELKYSKVFMTTIIMSIPNILLLYVVPGTSITIITILILNRVRKIKEVEKKKLVSETPVKKKDEEKSENRKRSPSVF